MLVSKPTHGGGAPLGIDLDAGIATIKIVRPAPPPAEDEAEVTDVAAGAAGTDATTADPDPHPAGPA